MKNKKTRLHSEQPYSNLRKQAEEKVKAFYAEMLQSQQDSQVESIINRADEAMYTAKHKGRNQIVKYREEQ